MGFIYYIPRKSALLSLLKAARVRLAANSEQARRLSDTRIASATKEMNQISDDIRDAKDRSSSHDHVDAATTLSKPADPEVALPITVTAGADLRAANSKAPDTPIQVDKGTLVNLSAEAGEGVQWRGDYNALAPQREIAAFVSQLAALGYSPREFRVTVRTCRRDLRAREGVLFWSPSFGTESPFEASDTSAVAAGIGSTSLLVVRRPTFHTIPTRSGNEAE